ncbi:MAG: hypothetical protein SFY69_02105 [Planctomycetota bacterium]|nr:hypothetical protein [Planctomycetota bacterium]
MRRVFVPVAFVHAVLVPVLAAGTAVAQPAVDQDNLLPAFFFGGAIIREVGRAQTFTVGLGGTLTSVDLQLWRSPSTPLPDVTFTLLGTTPLGFPDPANVLATRTIPITSIPESTFIPDPPFPPITVDLAADMIPVQPGEVYAIALTRAGLGSPPWVLWGSSGGESYAGGNGYFIQPNGQGWQIGDADFGFRTVVNVPAPGAAVFAGLLFAPLARRRR